MRTHAALMLLSAGLIVGACNTTPPATSKPAPKQAKTAVEAVYEALAGWNARQAGNPHRIDRPATLELLAKQRHHSADLNGDGKPDEIWQLALVEDGGDIQSLVNPAGNYLWAVLQQGSDGGYKAVYVRSGIGPSVLPTSRGGWQDLLAGWREDGVNRLALLRYENGTYKQEWEGSLLPQEGAAPMVACPLPDEVLTDAARVHFPSLRAYKLEMPGGAAFRDDLDGDGNPELLLQIDSLRADGKLMAVTPTGRHPDNFFVYSYRNGKWQRIYATANVGPIRLPVRNPQGACCIQTQTNRSGPNLRRVLLTPGKVAVLPPARSAPSPAPAAKGTSPRSAPIASRTTSAGHAARSPIASRRVPAAPAPAIASRSGRTPAPTIAVAGPRSSVVFD